MNRIKFFGSVGMVMFIMWLCFWMFGGWYVKGSFETFSYIWLGVCVAVLVAVNCKLTKILKYSLQQVKYKIVNKCKNFNII